MYSKKYWLPAIAGAIFFAGCSNHKGDPISQKNIDTQTVLSIGKVKITAYEFEKNIKSLKAQSQNSVSNNLKNEVINKMYLLADAYDKGYNTNKHIDSIVNGAAHFMIAQPNGLLDQEKIKSYAVTADELNDAINRSKNEIHIEYLKFANKNDVLKNLPGGLPPQKAADFKRLIDKVDLLTVQYEKDALVWPFMAYWGQEEAIYSLKKDEVSPLLKLNDGYYLIHVESIEPVKGQPLPPDQMKSKLQFVEQQKLNYLFNDKAIKQANPTINNDVVVAFANKLDKYNYGAGHNFIKADFAELLHKTVLTYLAPARQTKSITINDFIDNYNTLFIKKEIINANDVFMSLNAMVLSDYAYTDAVKLGITRQPQFLLDENNYRNNVIFSSYRDQELVDKAPVTDSEILNVYNLTRSNYKQPENVIASLYYFTNQQEALRKKFNLRSGTLKFIGLLKTDRRIVVNYKSKVLSDTLKKEIFDMSDKGIAAKMVTLNGQYIVIQKEGETGIRIRSLAEVKGLIISEIKNRRLIKNQQEKIAALKNKYKPTINLTDNADLATVAK